MLMRQLTILALVMVALLPGTAGAAPRDAERDRGTVLQPAGGEFSAVIGSETCTELRAGGPSRVVVTGTYTWYGTLVGSGPIAYEILVSRSCTAAPPFSSPEVAVGRGSFSGTVSGRPAAFEYVANFRTDGQGHAWGGIVIKRGRGNLDSVGGMLRFNDDFVCLECPTSTYNGWITFGT